MYGSRANLTHLFGEVFFPDSHFSLRQIVMKERKSISRSQAEVARIYSLSLSRIIWHVAVVPCSHLFLHACSTQTCEFQCEILLSFPIFPSLSPLCVSLSCLWTSLSVFVLLSLCLCSQMFCYIINVLVNVYICRRMLNCLLFAEFDAFIWMARLDFVAIVLINICLHQQLIACIGMLCPAR